MAVHGGKDQEDRIKAVAEFRKLAKDVLVATDVASKGLDFPLIQHVINYDMPDDIENYVHRIGRTGRGNAKGHATTLINNSVEDGVLLDLKHLLIEANQKVRVLKHICARRKSIFMGNIWPMFTRATILSCRVDKELL